MINLKREREGLIVNKYFRRWVVIFIVPLFVLSLYPQKKSEAIIPIVAPIAIALLDAAGSVVTANALASVGTALLGGIAFGMIFLTPGDTSNVNGQVRVPTTTAAGSTSAMAAIAPPAPSTAPAVPIYLASDGSGSATGSTPLLACGNRYSVFAGYAEYEGPNVSGNWCTYWWNPAGPTPAYLAGGSTISISGYGCPAGYSTPSGGTCTVLTNARAAAPDQKADFTRSGTTLAPYAGDDSGNLKAVVSTTTTANDTVTVAALDSTTSLPRRISIQATADGGSKVLVQTQAVDANGNTYVDNTALTVSAAGQITGASRVPTAQVLTLNPTTGTYDVAAAPTATANPAAAATAPTTITFPTDYARDATVAGLGSGVSQLHTDSVQLHTDLTSTSASAPTDPTVKPTTDITDQLLDSSFTGLKAWTLPARSVACPTPSFSIWSQTFTIDAHCTLWASIAGQIQAISLVTWALMAMFIVLGA